MAGVTGLEPAASGVTGRRSNQLSYTPLKQGLCCAFVAWFFHRTTPKMRFIRQEFKKKLIHPCYCVKPADSTAASTAPSKKRRLLHMIYILGKYAGMVGGEGFEPPTYSV